MAEWVSHLIVADRVLEILPKLRKHEFCVGNIAPDCNMPTLEESQFSFMAFSREEYNGFLDRAVTMVAEAIV